MSISGDPKKLADAVTSSKASELENKLGEAYAAAKKLLDSALEESLKRVRAAIEAKASEASERLRSVEAEVDLRVKIRLDEVKSEFINDVISESRRRLAQDRGEWYRLYIEKAVDLVAQEAGGEQFTLLCRKDDINLVEGVAKKYGFLSVAEGPANIIGGFIAVSRDGSVRIDLTLDQLIAENEVMIRGIAARELFGGE